MCLRVAGLRALARLVAAGRPRLGVVISGISPGETPRGRMLGLQAIPAPLHRAPIARIAEADAGAGGGEPSRLLKMRCQEQRDLQSDLGKAGCQSARGDRAISGRACYYQVADLKHEHVVPCCGY